LLFVIDDDLVLPLVFLFVLVHLPSPWLNVRCRVGLALPRRFEQLEQ
jgi:hypothetical protein